MLDPVTEAPGKLARLGLEFGEVRAISFRGKPALQCEAQADVLDLLAQMPPREMRRALMTGFGNARLEQRERVEVADLPRTAGGKSRIGFLQ